MKNSVRDVPFTKSVRRNWRLIIIEGFILIALGLSAVIVPPTINFAVTVVLGWLFSASGLVGLITTLAGRHAPGFWWSLLSALLALAVGTVLIEWRSDSVASSITASLGKITGDARRANENFPELKTLIFFTPRSVTNQTKAEWAEEVRKQFGYELLVISREDGLC